MIIGFCGRIQSGKDTACDYLIENSDKIFSNNVRKHEIKKIWFATPIKNFCENFLNIPHKNLWGTNEDKNAITNYYWENLPHYRELYEKNVVKYRKFMEDNYGILEPEQISEQSKKMFRYGEMTVREVMQQVGEEMFLKLYPRIWLDKFRDEVCEIQKAGIRITLVADIRKKEQIKEIQDIGGIVIRLLRKINNDSHISETDIEQSNNIFADYIIDNQNMTEEEKNLEIFKIIKNLKRSY